MARGYTLVWCGWQHDVPRVPGLLSLQVPDAMESGSPVSGKILVSFQPAARVQVQLLSDRDHRPYSATDPREPDATLTVRDYEDGPPAVVPRDRWAFARLEGGRVAPDPDHVYMEAGFEAGKAYEVVYTTTGAPVIGLGFLATRDLASFLKYAGPSEGNPCAGQAGRAYAFGASQSGRYFRQLLYLGLNEDEADRIVFDGVIAHIAGDRRGEFNHRFGQPSRVAARSTGAGFPFTDVPQTDPETGRTGGLLSRLTERGKAPKIFFTNTSNEYWRADAALVHTLADGAGDVVPAEGVRVYHYSGTQHGACTIPLTDVNPTDGSRGQQPLNSVDYTPLLRAALVHLDRWVTSGEPPPASRHPRIASGTAVPPEATRAAFEAIPGVNFPGHLPRVRRLDFGPGQDRGIATVLPPGVGKEYPKLVSAVDGDGNEVAGVRLPDVSEPLATYAGWNLRHPDMGAPDQLMGLLGSTIPFPPTRADREASGDPRLSIEERYPTREEYLERVRQAAGVLVTEGYALEEDVDVMVEQGGQRYGLLRAVV